MPNRKKPTRWIYVLHNLQGHSAVSQFLVLDLNFDKDVSSLYTLSKTFQTTYGSNCFSSIFSRTHIASVGKSRISKIIR